jgi:hypothetical protein
MKIIPDIAALKAALIRRLPVDPKVLDAIMEEIDRFTIEAPELVTREDVESVCEDAFTREVDHSPVSFAASIPKWDGKGRHDTTGD